MVAMRRYDEPSAGQYEDLWYHADDLFTTMAVSNSVGVVQERYEYDDYGSVMVLGADNDPANSPGDTQIDNAFLFTGRYYDTETGLYYYRTRYLDPKWGRFTTRDTIGVWGDGFNFGNGLNYVALAPGVFGDPFGLAGRLEGRIIEYDPRKHHREWSVYKKGQQIIVRPHLYDKKDYDKGYGHYNYLGQGHDEIYYEQMPPDDILAWEKAKRDAWERALQEALDAAKDFYGPTAIACVFVGLRRGNGTSYVASRPAQSSDPFGLSDGEFEDLGGGGYEIGHPMNPFYPTGRPGSPEYIGPEYFIPSFGGVGRAIDEIAPWVPGLGTPWDIKDLGKAVYDRDGIDILCAGAGFIPGGDLLKALRKRAKALKKKLNMNRNRVVLPDGRKVDLDGAKHGDVETPHVHDDPARKNHPNKNERERPRPATEQDIDDAEKQLKEHGPGPKSPRSNSGG